MNVAVAADTSSATAIRFSQLSQSTQTMTPSVQRLTTTLLAAGFHNRSISSVRYMTSSSSSTPSPRLFTHVDKDGKAHMVDVGHKKPTTRIAVACGTVYVGPEIANLIRLNSIAKGDVVSVSQIAGIVAAKRTSEIIPLCHNIPLSSVDVKTELNMDESSVLIMSTVKCEGKTGVEMEALTAVATAALTIYDMCKALSQDIIIKDIMLLKKSGGKVNYQRRNDGKIEKEQTIELKYNHEPITLEPFVPTHI